MWVLDELSSGQISAYNSETDYWISYYQLNAVRIGNSSRIYNCHGYAWLKSEDMGTYWLNYDQLGFLDDQNWSNDGQPSYISASESATTHSHYTDADHSARKIQNSYPVPISDGRDYVSKWGQLALVQHAKNHDVYYLKQSLGHDFRILKTTYSGTLSYSPKTWIGAGGQTHTITGDITVPSGVTLRVNPGNTVVVSSNYKLRVEGTLTAVGTYTNKITFTRSGGTWYGIEFYNGANGSEITWCNVTNAQYGIYMYNTDVWLESNSVKYNTVGMRFENQSDGSGIVKLNVVSENNDTGIQCLQYSDPLLFSFNLIRYNNFYGVYGDNTSAPDLGIYSDQGHNGIYYNNDDVYSSYGGTIYARYNWWGDYPASPTVSYNVDYSNALDYDPTSGMGKIANATESAGNAKNKLADGANADTLGMAEVNLAHKVFLGGDYECALPQFEGLVGKYPDHFAGRRALAFVSRCLYKLNRRNEMVTRMNQLVQNHTGKEVFGLAQSFATGELVKNGQYAEAIATSQTILNDFPKTTLAKYALYDLGSIYWYRLADQKTGEAYYRQLIAEWPDDDLTISALATLDEWQPAPGKGHAPALTNTPNVPGKFALSQNFPNPFLSGAKSPAFGGGNPQTMLQYQLPEASHITLKIYNLFGQEVKTLFAGQREAGYHSEIWDGRDDFGKRVASGVYFYRLSVEPNATQPNGFQFTRKMVLTQ